MDHISSTAMVLAAGMGVRMRPLTLEKPKPLLEVGGRTMLDLALDRLVEVGIRRAVVNAYYLGNMIEAHVARRNDIEIVVSREAELLDTGGGIRNALAQFGGKPFFALNADLPWRDMGDPALARMARAWDAAAMDALLLVMPTRKARGFSPDGDFGMDLSDAAGLSMAPLPSPPHEGEEISLGLLRRAGVATPRPYVMLSAQIAKPEFYAAMPERVFSNNRIWDEAERKQRLYGIVHDGSCYHVGRPEDLLRANELLSSGAGWDVA
ncbi:MAG: nucleotidyltransferase family protein [Bdellovibrionales bacterium]